MLMRRQTLDLVPDDLPPPPPDDPDGLPPPPMDSDEDMPPPPSGAPDDELEPPPPDSSDEEMKEEDEEDAMMMEEQALRAKEELLWQRETEKNAAIQYADDDSDDGYIGTTSRIELSVREGFLKVLGKFEGDPFETLAIKVDRNNSGFDCCLIVRMDQGDDVVFNLSQQSFVCRDPSDDTSFILDHNSAVVVFKTDHVDDREKILGEMPPEVFDVTRSDLRSLKDAPQVSKGVTIDLAAGDSASVASPGRPRRQTVSLALSKTQPWGRSSMKHIPRVPVTKQYYTGAPPVDSKYRRKELMEHSMKKPQVSIRKVTMLCRWINSLHLWEVPLELRNLNTEMCSGLLLARLMKHLVPTASFLNLNPKVRVKKSAEENLEHALGIIWRSKSINTTRVPSAVEILHGNMEKLSVMLQEVFEVYVMDKLYKDAIRIFKWYNKILKQYGMPISQDVFDEGDLQPIWPHFHSGTAIFCVIYHLYGPVTIGRGATQIKVDPIRVFFKPVCIAETRANLQYVFALLKALEVELVWDVEDWLIMSDSQFTLLQLANVFEVVKRRQCCLPPAQGHMAGVSSGPHGEPRVVGMVYADTRPAVSFANSSQLQRSRIVLLGSGTNAVSILPVDTGGRSSRFISNVCPPGLHSSDENYVRSPMHVKKLSKISDKGDWNECTLTGRKEDKYRGHVVDDVLQGKGIRKPGRKVDTDTNNGVLRSPRRVHDSGIDLGEEASTASKVPLDAASVQQQIRGANAKIESDMAAALDVVEKEMMKSQEEMDIREDELANLYIDLESGVEVMPSEVYEQQLEDLEATRLEIDEERRQLQEHFTMRLNSIKSQHQEALLQQQHKDAELLAKLAASDVAYRAAYSPRPSSKMKTAPSHVLEDREWVHAFFKADTHNHRFNVLQRSASEKLARSWTPKKMRGNIGTKMTQLGGVRLTSEPSQTMSSQSGPLTESLSPTALDHLNFQAQSAAQTMGAVSMAPERAPAAQMQAMQSSDSFDSQARQPMATILDPSIPQEAAEAFERFKVKLLNVTKEWKHVHSFNERQMMQAAPTTSFQREKLEKDKADWNNVDKARGRTKSSADTMAPGALNYEKHLSRDDEKKFMQYEDERRRKFVRAYDKSKMSYGSPRSPRSRSASPSSARRRPRAWPSSVNMGDVDASFKWLSAARAVYLGDRSPKKCMLTCVRQVMDGDQVPVHCLQWFDPAQLPGSPASAQRGGGGGSSAGGVSGYVVIEDVVSIDCDPGEPLKIRLLVGDDTRALKASGGRTTVSIQCATAQECSKYKLALKTLHTLHPEMD
jgi:hypothetical protein